MIEPPVTSEEELPSVRQLPRLLTPFAIPAYRRMALALTCGAFAYGVWTVALVWEVIRLGGGPAQLSVVSTAGAVGVLLPALLAGVVADGIHRLAVGVRSAVGIESLVWLVDVAGLSREDASALMQTSAVALLHEAQRRG